MAPPAQPHGPPHRVLLLVALWGLVATVLLGSLRALWPAAWAAYGLADAHRGVALAGLLLPALTFLHLHALDRLLGIRVPRIRANFRAFAFALAALLAAGAPMADAAVRPAALAVSGLALLVAGGATTGLVLRLAPKPGRSVVDVARDPLTKGDDASLAHVRFAHMLLPVGLALQWLGGTWWAGTGVPWEGMARSLDLAGDHVLLAGYALVSLYGIAHLWVPRLSGVPAIAAGAIKGELHSSRLGLVLMPVGFLLLGGAPAGTATATWGRACLILGGLSLFLGAFVFMGVLGANIMKNKSPTQRVTPAFVYVPWTFASAFWLIAGVLLGVFLNAVPEAMAARAPDLRFVHHHLVLVGGMALQVLGFATRILPDWSGRPPPTFQRTKWAFYTLNGALAMLLLGRLLGNSLELAGSVLAAVGLGAWFISMAPHLRAPEPS